MNANFSPSAEGRMEVQNRSYVAFLEKGDTREIVNLDILTDYNPKCYLHGNFFISEENRGSVLKIQAKTRRGDKELTKVIQHTFKSIIKTHQRLSVRKNTDQCLKKIKLSIFHKIYCMCIYYELNVFSVYFLNN